MPMREKQFNIRLNDEEAARLEEVTKHYGLNGAGLFRMLLKREHDRIAEDEGRREARSWHTTNSERMRKEQEWKF